MDQSIVMFQSHLHGPKFSGLENGERKDWIATGDVLDWLREMRSESIVAGDTAAVMFTTAAVMSEARGV